MGNRQTKNSTTAPIKPILYIDVFPTGHHIYTDDTVKFLTKRIKARFPDRKLRIYTRKLVYSKPGTVIPIPHINSVDVTFGIDGCLAILGKKYKNKQLMVFVYSPLPLVITSNQKVITDVNGIPKVYFGGIYYPGSSTDSQQCVIPRMICLEYSPDKRMVRKLIKTLLASPVSELTPVLPITSTVTSNATS
jgi:hypothetical protein